MGKERRIRITEGTLTKMIMRALQEGAGVISTDGPGNGDGEHEEPREMTEAGRPGRKAVRLDETAMRRFVSYSVARLLKEGYGREISLKNGESDGYEESKYGSDTLTFEPDELELDKIIGGLLSTRGYDTDEDKLESCGIWPVSVTVDYTLRKGARGDQYMTPDDPDEAEVLGWRIDNEMSVEDPETRRLIHDAVERYMRTDFDIDEELANESVYGPYRRASGRDMEAAGLDEAKGYEAGGSRDHKYPWPESRYKDEKGDFLPWDEYVKAKSAERDETDRRAASAGKRAEANRDNNGIKVGAPRRRVEIDESEIKRLVRDTIKNTLA